MVIVPVRAAVAAFAAAEYPTGPEPVPDAPDVTVSQLAFDKAVHVQPVPAVTETLPVDAVAANVAEVGEIDGDTRARGRKGWKARLRWSRPGPTADTRRLIRRPGDQRRRQPRRKRKPDQTVAVRRRFRHVDRVRGRRRTHGKELEQIGSHQRRSVDSSYCDRPTAGIPRSSRPLLSEHSPQPTRHHRQRREHRAAGTDSHHPKHQRPSSVFRRNLGHAASPRQCRNQAG